MNMMFGFINFAGIVLETLIILSFFRLISTEKRVTFGQEILLGGLLVFFQSVIMICVKKQMITTAAMLLSIVLLSCKYKMRMIKRLACSVVLMILFILSEIVTGLLLTVISSVAVEQLSGNVLYYMQGVLMSKLLMFIIIKAFSYFSIPSEVTISGGIFATLIVFPVATFMAIYVMSEYMYKTEDGRLIVLSAITAATLIVSNIALFYLFEYQLREAEARKEQQMMRQQLEYKAEYYKDLSIKQKYSNKAMHDLKNQLFALKEALLNNEEEGIRKITRLCEDMLTSQTFTFTGNEAVDALLTMKIQAMKEKEIKFTHIVYMSKDNTIDMLDLCVLLGNLLDNAMEANEKVSLEERFIHLNMVQKADYLSIQINNATDGNVKIENNQIITTKKQKELHGFGLQSVREITEKYNGNCTFCQEGHLFQAVLMLENN